MQQSPDEFVKRVRGWMRSETHDPAMDQYAAMMKGAAQAASVAKVTQAVVSAPEPTPVAEPHVFKTAQELEDFGTQNRAQWKAHLTAQQKLAVNEYKSIDVSELPEDERKTIADAEYEIGYKRMNRQLRGIKASDDQWANDADVRKETERRIGLLDSAIEKSPPLDRPLKVYRHTNYDELKLSEADVKKLSNAELRNLKIGETISDKGFRSTSANPKWKDDKAGWGDVTIEIDLPAGIKVGYMDSFAQGKEAEILLQRDSKIKITSVEKRGKRIFAKAVYVS